MKLFDDSGKRLDRFGLVLLLTTLSVTLASVIDLDQPTETTSRAVGWIITTLIVGMTLVLSLNASGVAEGPRRVALGLVVVVVVGSIIVSMLAAFGDFDGQSLARPSIGWVVLAAVSPVLVTRRLFLQRRVSVETIYGAVAAFLLIAIAFYYLFLAVDGLGGLYFFGDPQPTTSFMYFSLVTVTTLGYGDLTPATEWARYFATADAVIGTLFLVTVIARLVSLFGSHRPPITELRQEIEPDHDREPS